MTLYLLENRLPSFNGSPYRRLQGMAGANCSRELRATGCRGPGPQRLSGPPPLHPGSAPNPNLDPLSGLSLYSSELKWLNQEQADSQLGLCCQLELDPCRTGDAHSLSTQATLACLFLFAAFT